MIRTLPDTALDRQLTEDMGLFYSDPLGFIVYAFPWDTDTSIQLVRMQDPWRSRYNVEFGVDRWACGLLDDVAAGVRARRFDGVNPVEVQRHSVTSGHGIGKALAAYVVVPTPDGPRRWGDVKPGDQLFDENGEPTRVVATQRYSKVPSYRVTFDDQSYTDVSGGHLWAVRHRGGRRDGHRNGRRDDGLDAWQTLETIEILRRSVKRPDGSIKARQWEIPAQKPARFGERPVSPHPYFVGLWLGGERSSGEGCIRTDEEAAERLEKVCGYAVTRSADRRTVCVEGLRDQVGQHPLFSCCALDRYIPDEYKYNTVETRMELFRGLCDSNGRVSRPGVVRFFTGSGRLAADVAWLARSLGCKAVMRSAKKKKKDTDTAGGTVEEREEYLVMISTPFNPFTVPRRRDTFRPGETRLTSRWIDKIEYIGNVDVMCAEVENPSGLYLANAFIVTHNSQITAMIILWLMSTRPHCKIIVTANTEAQLNSKTWAELGKWKKKCVTGHWFEYNAGKGSSRLQHRQFPETWRADAQTCREENSEAFAGLHAANSSPVYIFDESSAVPDKIWEVAEGGLTDGEPFFFAFGNMTRRKGAFYDTHYKMAHRWMTRRVDSRDVQITNKQLIGQWVEDYGEDSDFVRVRVRGLPPNSDENQLIPTALIVEARRRELTLQRQTEGTVVVGVDVARYGGDESVIATRAGRDARSWPLLRFRGLDTMQLASRVAEHLDELRRGRRRVTTFVDGGGVGGGVVDRLLQLGYDVIEVAFGGKADSPRKYRNKRTEMYGRAKEWLKTGCLPDQGDDADDLAEQLGLAGYLFGKNNELILESKDSLRQRGVASPDLADAFCTTFAYPVSEFDDEDSRLLSPSEVKTRLFAADRHTRTNGLVSRPYDPYEQLTDVTSP